MKSCFVTCSIFVVVFWFGFATCDINQDKAKCANQLVGLATCLPYVSGQANAPAIDCCKGFKEVVAKSAECVCILVRDKDDPSLGLKINATRALSLQTRCDLHTDQSITDCVSKCIATFICSLFHFKLQLFTTPSRLISYVNGESVDVIDTYF